MHNTQYYMGVEGLRTPMPTLEEIQEAVQRNKQKKEQEAKQLQEQETRQEHQQKA